MSVSTSHRVTLYHADGCHLCERAIEVVRLAQARTPFTLELIDIGDVDTLEAEYRELSIGTESPRCRRRSTS